MKRDDLNRKINRAIAGIDDPKEAAHVAVDTTLAYLLEYVQEVSAELITHALVSESLVSGLIHQKLKRVRSGEAEGYNLEANHEEELM